MTDHTNSNEPHSPKQHLIAWLYDELANLRVAERKNVELDRSEISFYYISGKMSAYNEVLDYIKNRW